jgi:hypothetical protein
MRKVIGSIFAALVCCGGSGHAGSLHGDFALLLDRCRVAVEQSVSLDKTDLQPTQVHEENSRSWGTDTSQVGWALSNSELYIVFTTWTSRDGPTRNLCDVYLQDPGRVLSEDEQGRLLRHFLLRQTQLIGEGTHEIDRRLSPVPPLINLGFLLSAQNPRGCTATNTIALLPDGTYFSAGSGEQAIKACDKND